MENGKLPETPAKPETVEYPVLEVEGVPYQVKFTVGTLLRLQRAGVDLAQLGPQPVLDGEGKPVLGDDQRPQMETKRWPLDVCFQVLAALISHGQRKFTGEELADLIPADRVREAVQKLTAGFSKVSPQAAPTPDPTSPQ